VITVITDKHSGGPCAPNGSNIVYQHDNAPIHTARLVTEWFDKHESEVQHIP